MPFGSVAGAVSGIGTGSLGILSVIIKKWRMEVKSILVVAVDIRSVPEGSCKKEEQKGVVIEEE